MTIHAPTILPLDADDAVRCHVTVPIGSGEAFEKFSHNIARWWPREFTWSGDALEDLFLEGRKGGMLWERGPKGFRLDWARVQRWLPPDKLVLRWHIGPGRVPQPDMSRASEVEVNFAAAQGHTRIAIEHRGFASHGAGAVEYRLLMGSPDGWPKILERFGEYCQGAKSGFGQRRAAS